MGTGNGWGRVCDNTNHFGYHIKDIIVNMNIEGGRGVGGGDFSEGAYSGDNRQTDRRTDCFTPAHVPGVTIYLPFSSAPVAIPLRNIKMPRTAGWGERGTKIVPEK